MSFLLTEIVTRRKDSRNTREIRIGRTKTGPIFKIARNGRTIKTTNGSSDAGEEPGMEYLSSLLLWVN